MHTSLELLNSKGKFAVLRGCCVAVLRASRIGLSKLAARDYQLDHDPVAVLIHEHSPTNGDDHSCDIFTARFHCNGLLRLVRPLPLLAERDHC
jgi:hypothetical protein